MAELLHWLFITVTLGSVMNAEMLPLVFFFSLIKPFICFPPCLRSCLLRRWFSCTPTVFSISCPSRQEDLLFINQPILLMKVSSRTNQNMCVINQHGAICNLLQMPQTSLFRLSQCLLIDNTQMLMTMHADRKKDSFFGATIRAEGW